MAKLYPKIVYKAIIIGIGSSLIGISGVYLGLNFLFHPPGWIISLLGLEFFKSPIRVTIITGIILLTCSLFALVLFIRISLPITKKYMGSDISFRYSGLLLSEYLISIFFAALASGLALGSALIILAYTFGFIVGLP